MSRVEAVTSERGDMETWRRGSEKAWNHESVGEEDVRMSVTMTTRGHRRRSVAVVVHARHRNSYSDRTTRR